MPTVSTFTSVINQLLPEPHAGLLSGILFGTKMTIDPALKEALITTGTLHIVALSGMNITMLTDIVSISLLWVFPRKIATLLTIPVIIGFILFVGPSASIIRAAIMGGLTLLAVLYGKNVWALWSWGIAVVLMLIVKPIWITDLSFQLSVLASLGIILFGGQQSAFSPPTARLSAGQGRAGLQTSDDKIIQQDIGLQVKKTFATLLSANVRTTLAAQVFTIPLLLVAFGRLSLISPMTNALIIWTLPILTVLGFFIAITGFIFLPIGQVCAWAAWIFLEFIIQVIMWTSRIPGASIGT